LLVSDDGANVIYRISYASEIAPAVGNLGAISQPTLMKLAKLENSLWNPPAVADGVIVNVYVRLAL